MVDTALNNTSGSGSVSVERREYTVDKMKFIVTPKYRGEGSETLKSVLLRLIKADIEQG